MTREAFDKEVERVAENLQKEVKPLQKFSVQAIKEALLYAATKLKKGDD